MRESEKECTSNKVLRINFEDLIYNYDTKIKEITKKDIIILALANLFSLSLSSTAIFLISENGKFNNSLFFNFGSIILFKIISVKTRKYLSFEYLNLVKRSIDIKICSFVKFLNFKFYLSHKFRNFIVTLFYYL